MPVNYVPMTHLYAIRKDGKYLYVDDCILDYPDYEFKWYLPIRLFDEYLTALEDWANELAKQSGGEVVKLLLVEVMPDDSSFD